MICASTTKNSFLKDAATPFGYGRGEGINAGIDDVEWVIAKDRFKYDQAFDKLNPIDGKISGAGKNSSIVSL